MELRHLRAFVVVAAELNFTSAARTLRVAQPALSRTIADLEEELGLTLLRRDRHQVVLTAAGTVYVAECRRLLAEVEAAGEAAGRAARGEVGRLVIGLALAAVSPFLPRLIRDYREDFPGVEVVLQELSPAEQWRGLADGRIDLALTRSAGAVPPGLGSAPLYNDTLVAALPEGHPALARGAASLNGKRLPGPGPWWLFHRGGSPEMFDLGVATLAQGGIAPEAVRESATLGNALLQVAAGLGFALVPGCWRWQRPAGVVFRPLRPASAALPLLAAWRDNDDSPPVEAFRWLLDEQTEAIRQQMEGPGPEGDTPAAAGTGE